jgi:hypothetical protein
LSDPQHLQALEDRAAKLEEENENFRDALSLPPSSRPALGRGPKDKDQPYQDADDSRRQTMSPSDHLLAPLQGIILAVEPLAITSKPGTSSIRRKFTKLSKKDREKNPL